MPGLTASVAPWFFRGVITAEKIAILEAKIKICESIKCLREKNLYKNISDLARILGVSRREVCRNAENLELLRRELDKLLEA